jgi:hypothetical protein
MRGMIINKPKELTRNCYFLVINVKLPTDGLRPFIKISVLSQREQGEDYDDDVNVILGFGTV